MYEHIALEQSYPTPYASINTTLLSCLVVSMLGQKHSPKITQQVAEEYDYVVVGAGTAGSVVASRLSEKGCVSVLVLEAGKPPPKLTDVPAIYTFFAKTDLDWNFKTVAQRHTGAGMVGRSMKLSAGKTIGGSSVINGMQNIRGHRKDFDHWSSLGATGWSYEEVLPYFKKLENNVDAKYNTNGYHGRGGPITISTPPYDSELEAAVYSAIERMGYNLSDANGPTQDGFYDFQATMREGQRCSTAKGYLVPKEDNPNLAIVAGAYVKKIVIEEGEAKGVVFDYMGIPREVRARKEVILSAGTINSAKILMLSGIGPAEELGRLGIPIKSSLPVGKNLQEQWGVLSNFVLDTEIASFSAKIRNHSNIWEYINNKTGPLTSISGVSNMAFLSTAGYPASYPDFELYFGEGMHERVRRLFQIRADYHRSVYGPFQDRPFYWCLSQILHPKSRGNVTLESADPYDPPVIDPNYFSHPEDMDVVIAGMRKCKEIGTSPELQSIGSRPFSSVMPGCEAHYGVDEDAYFRCMARSLFITCSHQVGTCRMGDPADPATVVDPQLRVKNIGRLRVVDASVMPTVTSGNFIPTIMIGEKAADMIKETIQCDSDEL